VKRSLTVKETPAVRRAPSSFELFGLAFLAGMATGGALALVWVLYVTAPHG
jgi:hypothetical protein